MKRILFVLLTAALAGCTSGPQLDKYPRNEISRPYTLPDGVATWQIPMLGGYFKDNTGSVTIPPIPVPLFWQSSLSDTWTLNWGPLPTSVSHQLAYDKDSALGTTFGFNGLAYSTDSGLMLFPSVSVYWRNNFSNEWALEVTPSFNAIVSTKGDTFRWNSGVKVGPIYQVTDTFALRAGAEIGYISKFDYATLGDPTIKPSGAGSVVLPLSVGSVWSFHRQWDFRANYTFNGIGHSNGYQSHTFLLNFVHFW